MDQRVNAAGTKYEYLVHWKGYGPEEDSWEPSTHFGNLAALIMTEWRGAAPPKGPPYNKPPKKA